jgi:hypothetical protein
LAGRRTYSTLPLAAEQFMKVTTPVYFACNEHVCYPPEFPFWFFWSHKVLRKLWINFTP